MSTSLIRERVRETSVYERLVNMTASDILQLTNLECRKLAQAIDALASTRSSLSTRVKTA